jgi:hypothetical protein
MCCRCVGTKSMTEKITEGLARGRAKKTGGVLINTFKNQSIPFIKTAGFFDLWGGLVVGSIVMDGAGLTLPVGHLNYRPGIFPLCLRVYGLLCTGLSLHLHV